MIQLLPFPDSRNLRSQLVKYFFENLWNSNDLQQQDNTSHWDEGFCNLTAVGAFFCQSLESCLWHLENAPCTAVTAVFSIVLPAAAAAPAALGFNSKAMCFSSRTTKKVKSFPRTRVHGSFTDASKAATMSPPTEPPDALWRSPQHLLLHRHAQAGSTAPTAGWSLKRLTIAVLRGVTSSGPSIVE